MNGRLLPTLQRWLRRGLGVCGLAALTWCVAATAQARRFQAEERAALQQVLNAAVNTGATQGGADAVVSSGVIGELEIPRAKLSAIVVEGDDSSSLAVAVGHLPDTPMPWEGGNAAFAGHRDTFFRGLEAVRVGDEVRLVTRRGTFLYRVDRTRIVDPADLSVLQPTREPSVTLITCYPFRFIGSAPQRFVVQARQVAPAGGASPRAPSGSDGSA